jgi:orotate phosphoribosyltransferase
MTESEVIDIFRASGAIMEGHFILSSGLRSPVFIQKARVFQYPDRTEVLCRALAQKVKAADLGPIDIVVSPAVGGIVPGYETARHLNVPAVWVEREGGEFRLRRFELPQGARDRSGGEADIGVPLVSLARYRIPAYPADQVPPEMAAIPAVKPGSRGLA